ncbi:MAG: PD-(D/E)XK nuclease family protein [Pelolinea sp.]|jgi:CRISPR/Cas system-associated exonuclease Cas4 (RecB family)|nr:PD-(D/E)XK nuclease family protein [Pelolinea sp.]
MPNLPDFRFSSQSLQDFEECQQRFFLRYIQKMDWPAEESSPYLAFEQFRQKGSQFHACVEQYFHHGDPEKIERLIKDDDLRLWWKNFLRFSMEQQFTTASSEILFQTSLQGHILIAKYDLLVQQEDGSMTIFDWKTSASLKRTDREFLKKKMQTLVYPYVLCGSAGSQSIQPAQVKLVYWFPQYPDQPEQFPYSSIQMQQDERVLLERMEEITRKTLDEFPKTEDEKRCRYCVYRSYCERGKRAANLFEDDLELDFDLSELDMDIDQALEIPY